MSCQRKDSPTRYLLHNAIYMGYFTDYVSQLHFDGGCDLQNDYLIDIGDFTVMNQVMSSFLSRCLLPNIIVNKRVSVTGANKKIHQSLIDYLIEQCVDAGFVYHDFCTAIANMVSRVIPPNFELYVDDRSAFLNPLTYVVKTTTDV